MPVEVICVQEPTDAQFDQLVKILLKAFAKDVVVQSMSGGNAELAREGTQAIYRAGFLEGCVLLAVDSASKDLLGVALGFGPGNGLYMTEAQRALGFDAVSAKYTDEMKQWWGEFIQQSRKLKEDTVGSDRILQSWYADNIATDPARQGRGVGTALVKALCEKAKEDGVPLFLNAMTESNVAWYKKLGFEAKGTREFTALGSLGGEKCQSTLLVWEDSPKKQAAK
ncbi:hypothetical protein DFH08DRAFT_871273 [Mycena albidolilacea]|uniref:N-acetyltransferase domain-containing protein n=1 Tax=Mycena albidolilacea TaxID=1033008 RepID=A0AAD6ZY23_9AGAR|nr:hypothetical protein DFH08DRAFT_871273 [Mycena albidolilacea]